MRALRHSRFPHVFARSFYARTAADRHGSVRDRSHGRSRPRKKASSADETGFGAWTDGAGSDSNDECRSSRWVDLGLDSTEHLQRLAVVERNRKGRPAGAPICLRAPPLDWSVAGIGLARLDARGGLYFVEVWLVVDDGTTVLPIRRTFTGGAGLVRKGFGTVEVLGFPGSADGISPSDRLLQTLRRLGPRPG